MIDDQSPLSSLFGGYFHQDWIIEGRDAAAVVERFVDENLRDDVINAKNEAEALLAARLTEHELR